MNCSGERTSLNHATIRVKPDKISDWRSVEEKQPVFELLLCHEKSKSTLFWCWIWRDIFLDEVTITSSIGLSAALFPGRNHSTRTHHQSLRKNLIPFQSMTCFNSTFVLMVRQGRSNLSTSCLIVDQLIVSRQTVSINSRIFPTFSSMLAVEGRQKKLCRPLTCHHV